MPPKMRKKGRPKGAGLTVIGLPRKTGKSQKTVPFVKKSQWEKSKGNVLLPGTFIVHGKKGLQI